VNAFAINTTTEQWDAFPGTYNISAGLHLRTFVCKATLMLQSELTLKTLALGITT
jgi:hypothetical protein